MNRATTSIYIAYYSPLCRQTAYFLFRKLKSLGHDVFTHAAHSDSELTLQDFLRQLAARTYCLIVLPPLESQDHFSSYLQAEIQHALATERQIIPLLIEGARLEMFTALSPDDRKRLLEFNPIEASVNNLDEVIKILVERLVVSAVEPLQLTEIERLMMMREIQLALRPFNYLKPNELLELDHYYILAYAAKQRGEKEKAIEFYDAMITIDPDYDHIYVDRAYLKHEIEYGPWDGKGSRTLNGNLLGSKRWNAIIEGRKERERREQLLAEYTTALAEQPDNVELYLQRAYVLRQLGDTGLPPDRYYFQKAISDYTKVLEFDPNNPDIYYYRALSTMLAQITDYKSIALDDLNRALKYDPTHPLALRLRGTIRFNQRLIAAAIADFTEAIRGHHDQKEMAHALFYRSVAYFWRGELHTALADCTESIHYDPEQANIYAHRAYIYAALDNYIEAIKDLWTANDLRKDVYFYSDRIKWLIQKLRPDKMQNVTENGD